MDRLAKLEKINRVLMGRVERSTDVTGNGFSLFQTAILLEGQVRARTTDLEKTLTDLSEANMRLRQTRDEAETAKGNLTAAIEAVSEGFALFDDKEALVLCNTPFRALMPDAGARFEPGMRFSQIADLFAESQHIVLDTGLGVADWSRIRLDMFRRPHASFVQQVMGDRWIQVSNKRTGTGATVIFQTDITDLVRREREHRERQLDEQSRTLQATIDHLPQGICMVSPERMLRAWNYGFVSLLALPVKLVQPNASFDRILSHARQHALVTSQDSCESLVRWLHGSTERGSLSLEMVRSDGIVLDVSCNQMPDGGMVASFTDVTSARRASEALREARNTLKQKVDDRTFELQAANVKLSREINERLAIEQELIRARDLAEEANRSKTRFLAAASHDLLQPLSAARIFLSLLDDTPLDGPQCQLTQKINDAFGSVDQLLGTLLDISRYDSGAVEAEIQAVSLDDILAKLVAEFQPMADRKGLRLTVVPCGLMVRSDPRHLRRIVQNLIANAVRYTVKGRILVGVRRRRGGDAVIEVLDSGPGVAPEHHVAIFEEFRRLNNDTSNEQRGMGLGLAIVSRIARLLDHTIAVRSSIGKGSCFSVRAPIATGPVDAAAALPPRPTHAVSIAGKSVLVLENDMRILDAMMTLLDRWRMQAVPTASIQEALDLADGGLPAPDIIVADYHLDQGTGIDAIAALRALRGTMIPAVVVTADHGQAVRDQAARLGVEVLHKPVRSDDLAAAIARALG